MAEQPDAWILAQQVKMRVNCSSKIVQAPSVTHELRSRAVQCQKGCGMTFVVLQFLQYTALAARRARQRSCTLSKCVLSDKLPIWCRLGADDRHGLLECATAPAASECMRVCLTLRKQATPEYTGLHHPQQKCAAATPGNRMTDHTLPKADGQRTSTSKRIVKFGLHQQIQA